jgi:hypothetical protein
MESFQPPAFSILENQPFIDTSSLLIPPQSPGSIDTNLLFAPHSPSTDSASSSGYTSGYTSGYSSGCTSPTVSDIEDNNSIPMEQVSFVKRHLRMFPPPINAEEFIHKNSFQTSEGHIKRPSNNFILFRKIAHDQKNQTPELSDYNERQFSQIIGKIWKSLNSDEISTYKRLGKEVAEKHKALFPKYKYAPKRDKAAWKHFNPESNIPNLKSKRKNRAKQQKHQETITEVPKINIPQQQQQPQQQIVPENALGYTIPETLPVEVDLDQMVPLNNLNYYPAYPTNNTYTTNNPYMDLFNVNVNEDYNNSIWHIQ